MSSVQTKERPGLAGMADATAPTRDRFVDLLRALSIAVVVFGHWLVAVIYLNDGRLVGDSALNVVPGLWAATWILQVMPLFFFVGGFSNLKSWAAARGRGVSYGTYLRSRIERLIRPTLVFACVLTAFGIIAGTFFPDASAGLRPGMQFLAAPLWFLAVYVLVVALAPAMVRLHDLYRDKVLLALVIATVVTDVIRIGLDLQAFGYLNFAFVWLFAHQLGFYYGDGTLSARPIRFHLATAGAGLLSLVVLVGSGIYSPSMVTMVSERASNTSPPSICLIALSLWLVGVAMAVRPAVTKWLQKKRVWMTVIAANSVIMTIFLWHLTALLLAVAVAYPLGFPQPPGGSTLWWMWRPTWILILCTFLGLLVAIFGRYERPRLATESGTRTTSPFGTFIIIALLVIGLSRMAQAGFDLTATTGLGLGIVAEPLVSLAAISGGYLALTRRGRHKSGV